MSTPEYTVDVLTLTWEQFKQKHPNRFKNKHSFTSAKNYYRKKTMETPRSPEQSDYINQVAELLKRSGINPDEVEQITRVNLYQQGYKDEEGQGQVQDLVSVQFVPRAEVEHSFLTQAAPTVIKPVRGKPTSRKDSLTVALGDAQIGFRGEEPFHDERAMKLSLMALKELQPDNVVLTGDMIDLPAQSRFEQRPDWLSTTQAAVDRYHSFLAEVRANAPNAKIIVVHGNHEARLDSMIRRDAASILGIRRANAERELSVLTIQYLVRYEELEVESVDGYPNAAYWLEDNLKVTHGTNAKKGGSNAAKYLNEENETTIYGHTHRLEIAYKTIATRLGSRTIAAASPGCLARTDGSVPGYRYSVNNQGQTVPRAEDWQQGLLVIHHNAKNHDIHPIRINQEGMRIYDRFYGA